MIKVLVIIALLCFVIIPSSSTLPSEELLRKHIRQGLDAVTQDILHSEGPNIWHAYKFNSGLGNREELVVDSIISKDDFHNGQEVTEWQSLNVRDKSFAVGRMATGFTVMSVHLAKNNSFTETSKLLILEEYPTAYSLYKIWDPITMEYEMYLIVATASTTYNVYWFKITEELDLEKIGWLKVTQKVAHVKMFENGQYLKLFVIYERHVNSEITSADIFDIVLQRESNKFWLIQTLNLNCSSKYSAINKFANEIYLSIPQQTSNCVLIYKLSNNKFVFLESIPSKNVAIVTDFQIGHRTFLAIGGLNSAIYQFSKSGFLKVDIIDMQFAEVTYFLPLPVKTYRDEVILLVQQHIDFGSHTSPHVKVMIYSKEAFYVHDEIPCGFQGVRTHGATCLSDTEREVGITGATALSLGKTLGVLVPRYLVESGLFYFNWRLKSVDNPLAKKVDRIIKSRLKIEKLLQEQRKTLFDINEKLTNAINPNTDNVITGNWKVNTLIAPNLHSPNMQYTDPDEYSQKSDSFSFQSDFQIITDEIDSLQVKILNKRSAKSQDHYFDHLKINGQVQVQGGSHIENVYADRINDDPFDYLVEDCVRRSQSNKIPGTKTFRQADVERITFAKLNNVPAENIAYNTRYGTQIHGNVTFKNGLLIQNNVDTLEYGKVNGMDIRTDLVYMNSEATYASIKFQNLDTDYLNYVQVVNDINLEDIIKYKDINQGGLNIDLDYLDLSDVRVTTEQINHEEFKSFVSNLCLRNTECKFPGNVTVQGKVIVKGTAEINTLNGLHYPDEYVMDQEGSFIKITGKKTFVGNVSVNELTVEGLVDQVNPDEIITCTTRQLIPENFTFADLEVTESFQVDGDIYIGPNLTKFIPNPTLEDTETLNSNVLFSQLEVDGIVIVSNLFNNSTLKRKLEDVVYKDEDITIINSEKIIPKKLTIHNNLNIYSNEINNMEIRKILTLNTEQTISNHKINGDVIIENLVLTGTFNGENLTKHFEQFIKLDQNEIINSEIIFENVADLPDIVAHEMEISSVNNMNEHDFLLTIGDRNLGNCEFKSIKADNVEFVKDLNYDIECFDIEDYELNRFSLSKDQTITGKMRVVNGSVTKITTEQLNDVDWEFVKEFLNISGIFSQKFMSGKFKIEDLKVLKSIHLRNLNKVDFDHLFESVYWVNKTNNIHNSVEIQGSIKAEHIRINYLNNNKFYDSINDIVLNSEKDVVLKGHKHFNNALKIDENIHTNKINDLPVEHILLKSSEQQITARAIVHGNLTVYNNLHIEHDIPVNYISQHFATIDNNFIVKGNVSFQNYVTIGNMHVKGNANNIKPEDYLNGIVRIYDDIELNSTTVFKKKVRVQKNLGIATTVNDVNLDQVVKDIVLISSDDYIEGVVVFSETVEVAGTIELEKDLNTNILCGCDVQDWKDKAVYIVDGRFPDEIKFEKMSVLGNLRTNILNNVEMNNIIPLHTDQRINTTLNFGHVKFEEDVEVGNLINDLRFKEEYENTVLVNKDQDITSQLIFLHPITVTYNLKTFDLVNGKDLTRLVTIDTDQNLTASYIFNGKVSVDTDLSAFGRVNNINIGDWKRRTVTSNGEDEQDIEDKWKVAKKITFQGDVISDDADRLIGGLNVKNLANEMLSKQRTKFEIENVIKSDYKNLCVEVQKLVKIGKQKPFVFRHLEHHVDIHFENDISAVHYFKYNLRQYLIVSQRHNCHSSLYVWNPNTFKFIAKMRTGEVEQFITVLDSDHVYLVTKNTHSAICDKLGANVWIFNNDEMTHIYGFNQTVLLQRSKLPGTFYSMNNNSITEYRLYYEDENAKVHSYKHWDIPSLNNSSGPFNFRLDMLDSIESARSSSNNRVKRTYNEQEAANFNYEATAVAGDGIAKYYLPAANVREFVVFSVSNHKNVTKLTAVVIWEDAVSGKYADEIKIYQDYEKGKLFDRIITSRPSNINILQFGKTDETILTFMEDYTKLKLYEYKGYEGFRHRSTINIPATKMISVSLPFKPYQSRRKFLLLVNKQTIKILQATMYGDRPIESFNCEP